MYSSDAAGDLTASHRSDGLLQLAQRNRLSAVQLAISLVVRGVLGQRLNLLLSEVAQHDPVALGRHVLQWDQDFRFEQAEEAAATDHQVLLLVGIALHHALNVTNLVVSGPHKILVGQGRDRHLLHGCRRLGRGRRRWLGPACARRSRCRRATCWWCSRGRRRAWSRGGGRRRLSLGRCDRSCPKATGQQSCESNSHSLSSKSAPCPCRLACKTGRLGLLEKDPLLR